MNEEKLYRFGMACYCCGLNKAERLKFELWLDGYIKNILSDREYDEEQI